ncbi:helix-turn-helix domain-containing protein [Streptomyces drozdowiczii]
MTEKMRVLLALLTHGECSADQIVQATGIPAGRAFAALQAHLRAGLVDRDRCDAVRYRLTPAGRTTAGSWSPVPTQGAEPCPTNSTSTSRSARP